MADPTAGSVLTLADLVLLRALMGRCAISYEALKHRFGHPDGIRLFTMDQLKVVMRWLHINFRWHMDLRMPQYHLPSGMRKQFVVDHVQCQLFGNDHRTNSTAVTAASLNIRQVCESEAPRYISVPVRHTPVHRDPVPAPIQPPIPVLKLLRPSERVAALYKSVLDHLPADAVFLAGVPKPCVPHPHAHANVLDPETRSPHPPVNPTSLDLQPTKPAPHAQSTPDTKPNSVSISDRDLIAPLFERAGIELDVDARVRVCGIELLFDIDQGDCSFSQSRFIKCGGRECCSWWPKLRKHPEIKPETPGGALASVVMESGLECDRVDLVVKESSSDSNVGVDLGSSSSVLDANSSTVAVESSDLGSGSDVLANPFVLGSESGLFVANPSVTVKSSPHPSLLEPINFPTLAPVAPAAEPKTSGAAESAPPSPLPLPPVKAVAEPQTPNISQVDAAPTPIPASVAASPPRLDWKSCKDTTILQSLVLESCARAPHASANTSANTPTNDDISVGDSVVSFICPLSLKRVKHPARGRKCKHKQAFDAEIFLAFNENKDIWKFVIYVLRLLHKYPHAAKCIIQSTGQDAPFTNPILEVDHTPQSAPPKRPISEVILIDSDSDSEEPLAKRRNFSPVKAVGVAAAEEGGSEEYVTERTVLESGKVVETIVIG
ncbi:hypothetical protein HDU98_006364 [Podochytrium sp. JEL0797]|nr:hypothetical protein HDU98_006364 [Podochytrium sp. JEL0797]